MKEVRSLPAELRVREDSLSILPGENRREFELVRRMVIQDIEPTTPVEWLCILDLVEMSWEILRYRRLKQEVLERFRRDAIASSLRRIDGAGIPAECRGLVEKYCQDSAAEWSVDQAAATEIEARLRRSGIDQAGLNVEVFLVAREVFSLFDQLMQSAQDRRSALLREIAVRREFERRRKGGER